MLYVILWYSRLLCCALRPAAPRPSSPASDPGHQGPLLLPQPTLQTFTKTRKSCVNEKGIPPAAHSFCSRAEGGWGLGEGTPILAQGVPPSHQTGPVTGLLGVLPTWERTSDQWYPHVDGQTPVKTLPSSILPNAGGK